MYAGLFKAKDQQWQGRILVTNKDGRQQVRPLILNPPHGLKKMREGSCFRPTNNGWFDVHWLKPPATASDCLTYLEGLFLEAIDIYRPEDDNRTWTTGEDWV